MLQTLASDDADLIGALPAFEPRVEPDLPAANPGPAWALVVESVAARYGLSASRRGPS
ncbi:hypothetical protein [Streptosporangium sp. NPDC002607]